MYSRTEESARELAQKVEAEYTTSLEEVNPYAKLYIISLKDSAFAELLPAIVAGKRKEALMVHTAGSIPMSIWEGHASHYGVFYPMQTFSKQREVDSFLYRSFVDRRCRISESYCVYLVEPCI